MAMLDSHLDDLLARGRAYFSRSEAIGAFGVKPTALSAAITRAVKLRRLTIPRHGFYLILRPEDRTAGAPDPVKWIDPLMKHQGIDYRVSLLSAAAFHGSSHQASMVFQIIAPRQLRDIHLGRHRLQFLYQSPEAFERLNQPEWLASMKSDAGFATVAGTELTLLDSMRYFHKAAGISGVAQIVHDIGAKAKPRLLKLAAEHYESSTVRRLGYLLELAGHVRQSDSLRAFAQQAKTPVPLDPSATPRVKALSRAVERNARWKLLINETVEMEK